MYEYLLCFRHHLKMPLRKHAYSNKLKILPRKNENVQIKNSDIFFIFLLKRQIGVLVRTADEAVLTSTHNLFF